MIIEPLSQRFAICKVEDYSHVNLDAAFCFTGATDAERSLVCTTDSIPANATHVDTEWRAYRIRGQLDFSLTGILARIAAVMAEQGIGIFAISTFDTDYVLVKSQNFDNALAALEQAGYQVVA